MLSIFPGIFFYIAHITEKKLYLFRHSWGHYLPAVLFFALASLIPIVLTREEQRMYILEATDKAVTHPRVVFFWWVERLSKVAMFVQSAVYLIFISKLIRRYHRRLLAYFSNIHRIFTNWIYVFFLLFGISLVAFIPLLVFGNNYFNEQGAWFLFTGFIALSVVYYFIGYMADNHSYISEHDFYLPETTAKQMNNKLQRKLSRQLKSYFESEKPYLNPNLKITDVSSALKTNRTYISIIIKEEYASNFRDFVNTYRIKEASKMLDADTDISLIAVSEKYGFNSYNCFLDAFKKKQGCTPRDYRKR